MKFSTERHQRPSRRSSSRILALLILVYGSIQIVIAAHGTRFAHRAHRAAPARQLPITPGASSAAAAAYGNYGFGGSPVAGNGSAIDLGHGHSGLAPGFLTWLLGAPHIIMPSCLTEPPPATPPAAPGTNTGKPLPIRDYLPGFYGAPWTALVGGNLIALLHVYAPRNPALPTAATEFQLYHHYGGQQVAASYAAAAAVHIYRGDQAVLYRVFLSGPARCLDLVVRNDQNTGIGYLYYQRYHRYYETRAGFKIQQ